MKTQSLKFKKVLTLITVVVFGAFVLASCKKDDNTPVVNNNPYTLSGNANVAQVVPAITDTTYTGSSYMGNAVLTGSYNPGSRLLTYTTNWNNLSGVPTSGGFYSGASGSAGTPLNDAWTFDSTSTSGTGSISDTLTLTEEQGNQLTNGNWYYTFGTAANPNGEVRGQVTATR